MHFGADSSTVQNSFIFNNSPLPFFIKKNILVPCMDEAGLMLVTAGRVLCPSSGVSAAQLSWSLPLGLAGRNQQPGNYMAVTKSDVAL